MSPFTQSVSRPLAARALSVAFGICAVAAAFPLSGFAAPAEATGISLPNADLESGAAGWTLPQPNFSVVKGAGRNGSAGLVCEGKDLKKYQVAGYALPFKPGQDLEVSVWIKNDGLSKGEPGRCVEFFGVNGEYRGGCDMKLAPGQSADPKQWRKYVGRTGPLDPCVRRVSVDLYVGMDVTGRVVYDDVAASVMAVEPCRLFFTNREDDKAAGGTVRFVAKTAADLRPYDDPARAGDLEAFFTVQTTNGRVRVACDYFKHGRAETHVDVACLAFGAKPVVFTVRDKKENKELDRNAMTFTRLTPEAAAKRPAKSYFDQYGRWIVDGKPKYPLLTYMNESVNDDPRLFPALKRSPIDTVVQYVQRPNRAEMDRYLAHGIRMMPSLIYLWAGDYNYWPEVNARDEEVAATAQCVLELRDHPALLGWYLFDEPSRSRFPRVRERYKLVKALDPGHVCLTVINHGDHADDSWATCDVLGLDCYPIPGTGTEATRPANLARVAQETETAMRWMRHDKPLWLVPQAYPNPPERRFPTPHELRAMVWQGIARGANGVLFYSIEQMLNGRIRDTFDFEKHWTTVCDVAWEIKKHEDFLLSAEPPPALADVPAAVAARAWRLNGKTLLVVCNLKHEKFDGALTLDGQRFPLALGGDDVLVKLPNP